MRRTGRRSGTGGRAVGTAIGRLRAAVLPAVMLAVPAVAGAQDSFFGDLADAIGSDGLYVSGAGAASFISDGDSNWSAVPLEGRIIMSLPGSVRYATGFAARAAFGSYFGDFRVELEAGYLSSTIDGASGSDDRAAAVEANLNLDIDRFNIGLNAYFDIPEPIEGVRPYLGTGLSYGAISPGSVSGSVGGTRLSLGSIQASSQINFRIMAGIEYPIDDKITLDAGYRYIDGEDLRFSSGTTGMDVKLSGHQIGIGLRYHFWSLDDPLRRRPDQAATPARRTADRQPRGDDGQQLLIGLPSAEPPAPEDGAGPNSAPVLMAVEAAPGDSLPPPEIADTAGRPVNALDAADAAAEIRPVSSRRLVDSGPVAGLPRPPSPLDPGRAGPAAARQGSRLGLPSRPLATPVGPQPLPGRIPGQPLRRWPGQPRRDGPHGVYLGRFLSPIHARAFIADLQRLPGQVGPMRPDQLFIRHEDAFDGGVHALYGARMSAAQANAICLDLFVLRRGCQVTAFAGRQPTTVAPRGLTGSLDAGPAVATPQPSAETTPAADAPAGRPAARRRITGPSSTHRISRRLFPVDGSFRPVAAPTIQGR